MKFSSLRSTLFWRLSGVFLLILILLGLAYVSITAYSTRKYFQETTQRLNAHVAKEMLAEVNPFVNGEINAEAVGKIMHSMMAVNPSLEVYLLDPQGNILKYVVLDKKVRLSSIDLQPLRKFINTNGEAFVMGDDPRNPGQKTIFSATEVYEGGKLRGYVYMVLASEKYETISQSLFGSYFLRIGTQAFIITLVAAFVIGLLLIALLTRNLQKVIRGVRQFEKGDYETRIPIKGNGELADLSRTFNHMADTILRNIDNLKEVDKLRRELVANVSHDLRSPLSVIHGYIETMIIRDEKLTKDERSKYLDIILKSSEKLNKLVADLFELSKLEARQIEVQREKFNINELLQDTAIQYKLLADRKGVKINTELEKEGMAKADIALIQRVIQNLLDNAIKYSYQNSEVQIRSRNERGKIRISIVNKGEVIPEEDLPHIFDRYYKQGHEGAESSGLGLAIVKKIMDIHQSSIEVENSGKDETTFTFMLPAA